jgi:hypothetical protein
MRTFLILIILLLLAGSTACSDKENPENLTGIQEIRYGTSFGECLGYCRKNIVITPSEIEFTKQGWDLDGQLPDSSFREPCSAVEWTSLTGSIDLDAFLALDSVIGCPDCADGGAEWVEIVVGEGPYKVTFEYHNAPGVMHPYIDTLRNYMEIFE